MTLPHTENPNKEIESPRVEKYKSLNKKFTEDRE